MLGLGEAAKFIINFIINKIMKIGSIILSLHIETRTGTR